MEDKLKNTFDDIDRRDFDIERLVKTIVVNCVRNTFLESLHTGYWPSTEKGDYSDVKVIHPKGEFQFNHLSRISDSEMKKLMKEIVNKIYTFYIDWGMLDKPIPFGLGYFQYPDEWDDANVDEELRSIKNMFIKNKNNV